MPRNPAVDREHLRSFGQRLRFLRGLQNLTQAQLAERTGISLEHVNKLERGVAGPSFAVLCGLAKALDTEPANLFLFSFSSNPAGRAGGGSVPPGVVSQDWSRYISHVGLWELDLVTGGMTWSDSLCALLGYASGEVSPSLDLLLTRHLPPQEREAVENFRLAAKGREIPRIMFRFLRKDGALRLGLGKSEMEGGADGAPVRVHGAIVDITEMQQLGEYLEHTRQQLEDRVRERTRKLHAVIRVLGEEIRGRKDVEQDLRDTAEQFRLLTENMSDLVCVHDRDGRRLYVSPSSRRLLGYDPDELLSISPWELIHPDDAPEIRRVTQGPALQSLSTVQLLYRMRKKDGAYVWLETYLEPVADADGQVRRLVSSTRDVSERKKAEEALRESEELHRITLENISDAVYLTDDDGRLLYVCRNVDVLFGYSAEEMQARRNIEDVLGPCPVNPEGLERDGEVRDVECAVTDRAGDRRDLLVHVKKVSIIGASRLYVCRDVTARKRAEEALARSEQWFRTFLESLPLAALSLDAAGRVVFANDYLLALTGWGRGEVLGQDWFRMFLPEETARELAEAWQEVRRTGEVGRYVYNENPILTRQGEERILAWANSLHKNEQGEVTGLFSLGVDVTQRRRSDQEALLFQHVFASSTDALSLVGPDYVYLAVNESYVRRTGLPRERLLGAHVADILGKETFASLVKPNLDRCLAGEEVRFAGWFDYAGEGRRYMQVTYSPYREGNGGIRGVVVNGRDFTDQHLAEASLRENEARFWLLFDQAGDAAFFHDLDGRFLEVNQRACVMLGYERAELLGLTVGDVDVDFMARNDPGAFWKALGFSDTVLFESRHRRADGVLIPVEINLRRVLWQGRDCVLALVRDISGRKAAEEELCEAQRMLATLVGNLPGMAYRCRNDRHWTMEYVSEGSLPLCGYGPEELTGSRRAAWGGLILEEDRQAVWDAVQQALPERRRFHMEYRIRAADGCEKWVLEQGQGVFSPQGELVALEGFITDITERKAAEEELRRRLHVQRVRARVLDVFASSPDEHMYRDLLELILDELRCELGTFGYFDGEGRFVVPFLTREAYWDRCEVPDKALVFAHARFGGVWGTAVEEKRIVCDNTGPFHVPEGHVPVANTLVAPIVSKGRVLGTIHLANKEGGFLSEDEEMLDLIVRIAAPVLEARLEGEKREHGRVLAEQRLQESESRFRALFENAPLPYQSLDEHGRLLDVNARWLQALGYGKEEVLGRWFGEFLAPDQAKSFEENFHAFKDSCVIDGAEFEMRRKGGGTLTVSVNGRVQSDAQGRFLRTHCLFTDVTALKRVQALREEVERITRHDLKVSLSGLIHGPALLREEGDLNPTQRVVLRGMEEAADKMLDLLNRSLDLYRLEERSYRIETQPADLGALAGRVAEVLGLLAEKKNVTVSVFVRGLPVAEGEPLVAPVDETLCYSLLANLIQNAVEASPPGGRVLVSVDEQGPVAAVEIRNAGAVPEEIRDRFFEKYATAGKKQGLGLGAYSARLMAEAHGGSVAMETSETTGTLVTVLLPL